MSDEIVEMLALKRAELWEVAVLHTKARLEAHGLLDRVVVGVGEFGLLKPRGKASVPDATPFLQWLSTIQIPSAAGAAAESTEGAGAPVAIEDDGGHVDAQEYDVENDDGDLQDDAPLPGEVFVDGPVEDDASDPDGSSTDSDSVSSEEPAAVAQEALGEGEDPGEGVDLGVVEVLEGACDELLAPFEEGLAGPEAPAPGTPEAAPDFEIGPLGYVYCPRIRDDRTVGYISFKGPGDSHMLVNCHLHANCKLSMGVATRPLPKDAVGRWLCAGEVPPPGASRAEREEMGRRHKAMWVRPP